MYLGENIFYLTGLECQSSVVGLLLLGPPVLHVAHSAHTLREARPICMGPAGGAVSWPTPQIVTVEAHSLAIDFSVCVLALGHNLQLCWAISELFRSLHMVLIPPGIANWGWDPACEARHLVWWICMHLPEFLLPKYEVWPL